MKKIFLTLLAWVAISFATEQCNDNTIQIQAPLGSCSNEGYVCFASTDERGGVLFKLGKTANCQTLETTKFTTYPVKNETELNLNDPKTHLTPYMMEDPLENVGALAVATNTAFIINALNEKFKVCVIYHRAMSAQTVNDYNAFSIRLQSIGKCN